MGITVSYRETTDDDNEYLLMLFESSRPDLKLIDQTMNKVEKVEFLKMQFALQDHHYKTHYPGASFQIMRWQNRDIGRLYLHEGKKTIEILDITIDPKFRSKGIGKSVMNSIIKKAEKKGKKVKIYVSKNNRAINLYNRLGFTISDDLDVYHEMILEPKAKKKVLIK